jgi:hypothetical protein
MAKTKNADAAKTEPKAEAAAEGKVEDESLPTGYGPGGPSGHDLPYYAANALLQALADAAGSVQRVGELSGHASTARLLLRQLHRLRAEADRSEAQELRDAWEGAANRARTAYDPSRGELRELERAQSLQARAEVLGAWDALDGLVPDEQKGVAP